MVTAIFAVVAAFCGFAAGFVCAIKALQTGLKWNIQTQAQQAPTTERQDEKIAEKAEEAAEQAKQEAERVQLNTANMLHEYLYGSQPSDEGDE